MKIVKSLALLPFAVLAACSDGTTGSLSFALTSRPAAAPSVVAAGDSTVIALGNDTVIVRSVELVLREIELKKIDAATCDAVVGNDDCEEFETGATLVSLPLGATAAAQQVSVSADPGTYDALEFKIHKPSSSDDAAFVAQHPDFATISIRVTGTYSQAGSRSDFVFTSDVDQSEEMMLPAPVTVAAGEALNVTLRVDIAGWFLNSGRTALVDPASANKGQANESVVANNIQNSFKAFEDDDHDGLED
jgi:hypothetical protein